MLRSIKNYFFSAFREIFVYHHSSLEFRAKIYALLIASGNEPFHHYQDTLQEISSKIYNDPDRANALIITVKEYLNSVKSKKNRGEEFLLIEIIRELRQIPRYALKIEPSHLVQLQEHTRDHDSKIYQSRLITFLEEKRSEYQKAKH
jgi:LytS/YehU family sensor histidine kinase